MDEPLETIRITCSADYIELVKWTSALCRAIYEEWDGKFDINNRWEKHLPEVNEKVKQFGIELHDHLVINNISFHILDLAILAQHCKEQLKYSETYQDNIRLVRNHYNKILRYARQYNDPYIIQYLNSVSKYIDRDYV